MKNLTEDQFRRWQLTVLTAKAYAFISKDPKSDYCHDIDFSVDMARALLSRMETLGLPSLPSPPSSKKASGGK